MDQEQVYEAGTGSVPVASANEILHDWHAYE